MADILRNIKLTIAYDGTAYCGWQIQNNDMTVQGTIEKALFKIHRSSIRLTGSGRTDSGVHAMGQVANFYSGLASIPAANFAHAINSLIPRDIRILKSEEVDEKFHSRYDAVERIYRYYICCQNMPMPWQNSYCHYVRDKLDTLRLNEIVSPITGIHDFSSFSAPMEEGVSMIREIYSASFYEEYPYIVFRISGNAFLRKMVRSITGTVLDLYSNGKGADEMKKILDSCDRKTAGPTAPGRGLFLHKVCYGVSV